MRLINNITLEGHIGIVWCVSWSHNGKTLASCGEDRTIKLWSLKNDVWQCVRNIETSHEKTIRSIKWSPCDSLMATCGFDGKIIIWKDGEECANLDGHGSEIKSIDWSPDGLFLACCCRDKVIWVWERVTDKEFSNYGSFQYHTQDVKRVKWHPLSQELFSVSYDNCVKSYFCSENENYICNFSSAKHTNTVWGIDFNKDGSQMVTCSADKTLRIWSKKEGGNSQDVPWQCVQCISDQHDMPIYDVSWCKTIDAIATACGDNAVRVFRKSETSPLFELQCSVLDSHLEDVNCVSWNSQSSGLLASCSDDGLVKLWMFSF